MDWNVSAGRRIPAAAMALGLVLLVWCGCSRSNPNPWPKTYPLVGQVMAVDRAKHTVTIAHQAVHGLMPAMTMEFPVSPGDADLVRPGEAVSGQLVIEYQGAEPRLEHLWPNDPAAVAAIAAAANALAQDTHERGPDVYRAVGEDMPAFTLYDQDGRVVNSDRFRGKDVMLNFFYTACPFANMCPAETAKMMETQQLARKDGIRNIEFVSITLDPTHDTPGVLRDYANARHIDTSNYSFLTGPQQAVGDLLEQFGVIADFTGGFVKHTLSTVLIDPHGRIIWREDGSSWTPSEFVERMPRP